MFRRAVTGLTFAMLSLSAHAETKNLLGLRIACTGGYSAAVSRSSEPIYYDISGETKSQNYTLCLKAGGQWGGQRHGSAQRDFMEPCESFNLAAFTISCSNGTVSAVALTQAIRDMLRSSPNGQNVKTYAVQGDALYVPLYGQSRLVIVQKEIAHAGTLPLTVPHAEVAPPQLLGQLALPSGYGIADDWQAFRAGTISFNWDSARGIPLMAVSGSPPMTVPHVEPAAPWVQFLATVFPWGQLAVGTFVVAFFVVARAGFGHGLGNPDEAKKLRLICTAAVALLGLALSGIPASMPELAFQQARQQLEASRAQAAAVERDRTTLAAMFRSRNGLVQPIAQGDLQRINVLTQLHRIDPVSDPQPAPELWALLSLLPCLMLFVFYLPRFIVGWDWLSRKHPAEPVVAAALRTGSAINAHKLADVLTPDPRDLELRKPAFRHKHDAEKAKALKNKLDADAELAEAAIQREHKRADLKRKRAEVNRLERELGE